MKDSTPPGAPAGSTPAEWAERLAARGQVLTDRRLSADAIREIRAALVDAVESVDPPTGDVERLEFGAGGSAAGDQRTFVALIGACGGLHAVRPTLARELDLPALAAQLLGVPKAELVADEVLVKPAREGAEITWHQDWVVNPDFPDDYLTFWIPLDDVLDDDRGPVEFVIGSHRLGRFLPAEFAVAPVPHPGLMELERLGMPILPVPEESGLPTEVLRVPAGACSVHHSSIWHRSLPNKSDQPRLALAQRYRVPPVHIEKETVAP